MEEICGSSSSSTSSDEIHQPVLRNAKYAYSRHDLLSFGKLQHCRNFPNGFVASNLEELGVASTCMQDLLNGENRQGLLPSPEDGLCGRRSYRLSSRSEGENKNKDVVGEVISVANDCCPLKRSANPYRPPHSRMKTDHSSQGASSGTSSDCDSNSIIFYEIAEEQQRKENQSRYDEDDEDWDEIMSILRVEQDSLISYEAKDDQTVNASTGKQSSYDDDQTLRKTTTEICLPDDDDLITTNDLLVLEPILEYSLPDEDSLISIDDFVNPRSKIGQENFHHYKHQYCQPFQSHHQQQRMNIDRMNSHGSSGSFMNEMVNRSSNYYYTSNCSRIPSMTKRIMQTAPPLPYGFYQESSGVHHMTNPNYPYQIYPSNNPNRWSLNKSYMDPRAGFERQNRTSLDMHANKMKSTRKHFTLTGSNIQQQLTR